MCEKNITEATKEFEGQEAIFCEDESCQMWYHQWCVGVTKERYKVLATSTAPFLCPNCVVNAKLCNFSSRGCCESTGAAVK